MEKKGALLCLVDASSFIFRAFYAIRHLSNQRGLPTNATFGFANMVVKVLEDLKPSHIAVVYDTKEPSFRKNIYPEYKANRSAMPELLIPQIPYIKKFVEYLGLPSFEKPGFEADDIIAALSYFSHAAEEDVCIITSDKDLMQLVNHHTYLFDTMKDLKITAKEVKAKMGIGPELITDYLGLIGDASDNIPGVSGIGPKTAVTLLETYGSIEGIYNNLEQLKPGKVRDNLSTQVHMAKLSKELATVSTDVGITFDWKSLECKPNFSSELNEWIQDLEFQKLGERLKKIISTPSTTAASASEEPKANVEKSYTAINGATYRGIQDIEELQNIFQSLESAPAIAFDTETTGLGFGAKLVGFSFCASSTEAYYVPLRHNCNSNQIPLEQAIPILKDFLFKKFLIGQNLKYDLNIIRAEGIQISLNQIRFDTMLASYILAPEAKHNLNDLAFRYLQHEMISYESICGTGKNAISFADVPLDKAIEYAAEDAHATWLLYQKLEQDLKKIPSLHKVFTNIEIPLLAVLADMEWQGVAIHKKHLAQLHTEFSANLQNLERTAYHLAGSEFNIASPKQLQEVLFEKLNLPATKKTKTGFSTDVDVLSKLALLHELPAVILQYREVAKLKSTYIDVLPELADSNHRVHTNYMQSVTGTGRLASSNPNLQNIPVRTELGKKIRAAFVAQPGYYLVGADYSQIELRILAFLSGDPVLREAFREGLDIHSITAAKVFHVDIGAVTPDLRRKAKAINFGLLYGKTAFSLGEELGIGRTEAAEIIESYFQKYPLIKQFLDGLALTAREKGYAETMYGRRRKIEGINDRNKMVRAMAERMAVNTPIQGTAADLIKIAMVRLFQELREKNMQAKLILQVHDELVLEVPEAEMEEAKKLVKSNMEGVGKVEGFPTIDVPLSVEVSSGRNWLELS